MFDVLALCLSLVCPSLATSCQTLDPHPPWDNRRLSLADLIPDWPTLQSVRRNSEVGQSDCVVVSFVIIVVFHGAEELIVVGRLLASRSCRISLAFDRLRLAVCWVTLP